jgi:hypothetical protein
MYLSVIQYRLVPFIVRLAYLYLSKVPVEFLGRGPFDLWRLRPTNQWAVPLAYNSSLRRRSHLGQAEDLITIRISLAEE